MSPSTLISAALDATLLCHDVELWQPVAVGRCVTQCSETCKHCIMFTSFGSFYGFISVASSFTKQFVKVLEVVKDCKKCIQKTLFEHIERMKV